MFKSLWRSLDQLMLRAFLDSRTSSYFDSLSHAAVEWKPWWRAKLVTLGFWNPSYSNFPQGHRLNEGRLFPLWAPCFYYRPFKGKWRSMWFAFLGKWGNLIYQPHLTAVPQPWLCHGLHTEAAKDLGEGYLGTAGKHWGMGRYEGHFVQFHNHALHLTACKQHTSFLVPGRRGSPMPRTEPGFPSVSVDNSLEKVLFYLEKSLFYHICGISWRHILSSSIFHNVPAWINVSVFKKKRNESKKEIMQKYFSLTVNFTFSQGPLANSTSTTSGGTPIGENSRSPALLRAARGL